MVLKLGSNILAWHTIHTSIPALQISLTYGNFGSAVTTAAYQVIRIPYFSDAIDLRLGVQMLKYVGAQMLGFRPPFQDFRDEI